MSCLNIQTSVRQGHTAFSVSWHIVKDSSLIIPEQEHGPASPLGLSRTSLKFGSWVPATSARIWSTGDLIWTFTGVNLALITLAQSSPRPVSLPLLQAQENSNHHGNTENIKRLLIVVTRRIFPPWHAVQCPFMLVCGSRFKYSWRACLMVLQLNF